MVAELTPVAGVDIDHDGDSVLDRQNVMGAELHADGAAFAQVDIDLDHGRGFGFCLFVHEILLSESPFSGCGPG
jgi:hypothetical protein